MRKCINYFGEKQDFIKRRTTNFELSWANCFEIYRRTKTKKHRWREQQQHEITDWSEWKEKSKSACFLFSFFNKSKKDAFCFIERRTPRGSERMYKILAIAIAYSFFLILVCIFSAHFTVAVTLIVVLFCNSPYCLCCCGFICRLLCSSGKNSK